jgi:hypothetical protein
MFEIARGPAGVRQELFRETARKMRLHEAIIEKDFWVCCVLKALFSSPAWADKLIFKGGTSLSKIFKAIDRFSEDIDLILDWRVLGYSKEDPWKPPSNTRKDKFVAETRERMLDYLEKTLVPDLARELSPILGTEIKVTLDGEVVGIEYPKAFENPAIIPHIVLEIGPLASWTPHDRYTISPYAAEQFPAAFKTPTCSVKAVTVERTFWEKATILHQEANRPSDKPMPPRYSRHYYDVYRLIKLGFHEAAIRQISLLEQVILFKERFYRTPWARLPEAIPGTFKLIPSPERIAGLEKDYRQMQTMIFDPNPPPFSTIIATLSELEKRINA